MSEQLRPGQGARTSLLVTPLRETPKVTEVVECVRGVEPATTTGARDFRDDHPGWPTYGTRGVRRWGHHDPLPLYPVVRVVRPL